MSGIGSGSGIGYAMRYVYVYAVWECISTTCDTIRYDMAHDHFYQLHIESVRLVIVSTVHTFAWDLRALRPKRISNGFVVRAIRVYAAVTMNNTQTIHSAKCFGPPMLMWPLLVLLISAHIYLHNLLFFNIRTRTHTTSVSEIIHFSYVFFFFSLSFLFPGR